MAQIRTHPDGSYEWIWDNTGDKLWTEYALMHSRAVLVAEEAALRAAGDIVGSRGLRSVRRTLLNLAEEIKNLHESGG